MAIHLVSCEVRQLAVENDIHMLKLPPHLTHILQPLDVGVFKPLKALWYAAVANFTRREHGTLTKRDFPEILSSIWKRYSPDSARGGFKGCGIYPFNSTVISPHSTKFSEPFGNSPTCIPMAGEPSISRPTSKQHGPSSQVPSSEPSPPPVPSSSSEPSSPQLPS